MLFLDLKPQSEQSRAETSARPGAAAVFPQRRRRKERITSSSRETHCKQMGAINGLSHSADVREDSDGLAKNIQMETEYGLAYCGA